MRTMEETMTESDESGEPLSLNQAQQQQQDTPAPSSNEPQRKDEEDPLASPEAETVATSAEDDEAEHGNLSKTKKHYTQQELVEILSQVTQVDFDDEYMDPIEWTVRKVVPLPAVYFWDLLEPSNDDDDDDNDNTRQQMLAQIPWRIKAWHRVVGSLERVANGINRYVAQPVAGGLGITDSRFQYVMDNMTDDDMRESKRIVAERKARQQQQQKTVNKDDKDGDDML